MDKQYFIIDGKAGLILHGFKAPDAVVAKRAAARWQDKHDPEGQVWLVLGLGLIQLPMQIKLRSVE